MHASTSDMKPVTLAVILDASRSMLPPMLIFKGAKNGHNATNKFPTYPIGGQYLCQPKA